MKHPSYILRHADYPTYRRGCAILGRDPIPRGAFDAWLAEVIASDPRLLYIEVQGAHRDRAARIRHQFQHIESAVSIALEPPDDGRFEDSGVPAPILIGPFSPSGAERLEIPRDGTEDSAA